MTDLQIIKRITGCINFLPKYLESLAKIWCKFFILFDMGIRYGIYIFYEKLQKGACRFYTADQKLVTLLQYQSKVFPKI